jgi:hypothetical protein
MWVLKNHSVSFKLRALGVQYVAHLTMVVLHASLLLLVKAVEAIGESVVQVSYIANGM